MQHLFNLGTFYFEVSSDGLTITRKQVKLLPFTMRPQGAAPRLRFLSFKEAWETSNRLLDEAVRTTDSIEKNFSLRKEIQKRERLGMDHYHGQYPRRKNGVAQNYLRPGKCGYAVITYKDHYVYAGIPRSEKWCPTPVFVVKFEILSVSKNQGNGFEYNIGGNKYLPYALASSRVFAHKRGAQNEAATILNAWYPGALFDAHSICIRDEDVFNAFRHL
tara:strand:+ start:653 stop:1306 length:654 start_codon:yes stop_codon:yes gene_type:complete